PQVNYSYFSDFVPGYDGNAMEDTTIANVFKFAEEGFVSGARFLSKGPPPTNPFANLRFILWDGNDNEIASVYLHVSNLVQGWSQVTFSQPVAVVPDVNYMLSIEDLMGAPWLHGTKVEPESEHVLYVTNYIAPVPMNPRQNNFSNGHQY